MIISYISIGSNIGEKIQNINKAVEMLRNSDKIYHVEVSSYYETEPVGYLDQDYFVNIAVKIETDLEPLELLSVCQRVEQEMKRVRKIRWGPRIIDLDIIFYDDLKYEDENLVIPHPRCLERLFVLVPILELDDKLLSDGVSIADTVKSLGGKDMIRMIVND